MFTIGLAVGFLVYLAYLASRSVFRIQEGHVGVVTTLGAALREKGISSCSRQGFTTRCRGKNSGPSP